MPQHPGRSSRQAGEYQKVKPHSQTVEVVNLGRTLGPLWADRFGNLWTDPECKRHTCGPDGRWMQCGVQGYVGRIPDDDD
jgi:hypothetical protein